MSHPNRKLHRLTNFNYSTPGIYFVTICTKIRIPWFGFIKNNKMYLNELGEIALNHWKKIPEIYKNIEIHEFTVMSDHIHGIIKINHGAVGVGQCPTPTNDNNIQINHRLGRTNPKPYGLISKIVHGFKNACTNEFKNTLKINHFQWQRSFYDHIIHNENSFNNIKIYIKNNAIKHNKKIDQTK